MGFGSSRSFSPFSCFCKLGILSCVPILRAPIFELYTRARDFRKLPCRRWGHRFMESVRRLCLKCNTGVLQTKLSCKERHVHLLCRSLHRHRHARITWVYMSLHHACTYSHTQPVKFSKSVALHSVHAYSTVFAKLPREKTRCAGVASSHGKAAEIHVLCLSSSPPKIKQRRICKLRRGFPHIRTHQHQHPARSATWER